MFLHFQLLATIFARNVEVAKLRLKQSRWKHQQATLVTAVATTHRRTHQKANLSNGELKRRSYQGKQ
jgi:predicted ABC-type transport system involved in lysophospholipase L1 biosynthesis ATPase subunit